MVSEKGVFVSTFLMKKKYHFIILFLALSVLAVVIFMPMAESLPLPPTITSFTADPTIGATPYTSTLLWGSSGANYCTGTGFNTGYGTSGSTSVQVYSIATYTLTCTNLYGSRSASVTVNIDNLPVINRFYASPSTIPSDYCPVTGGDCRVFSYLSWSASNASSCTGNIFSTSSEPCDSTTSCTYLKVVPAAPSTTYTLTCSNSYGSRSASTTVYVSSSTCTGTQPATTTSCTSSNTAVSTTSYSCVNGQWTPTTTTSSCSSGQTCVASGGVASCQNNVNVSLTCSASPTSGSSPLLVGFTLAATPNDGTCQLNYNGVTQGAGIDAESFPCTTTTKTKTYNTGTYPPFYSKTSGTGAPASTSCGTISVTTNSPQLSFSPPSVSCGQVKKSQSGSCSPLYISNSNPSSSTSLQGQITLSNNGGGVFSCTSGCGGYTLSDGSSQQVSITFSPTAATNYTGTITITSNDPQNPTQTISITGIGTTDSTHTLTFTKLGAGSGTVTSSPSGINCGATCTTQSTQFSNNQQVILTETPSPDGSTFAGWGGDCSSFGTQSTCTLTMNSDKSVTAAFSGAGGGLPSCAINSASWSASTVTDGTQVTLTSNENGNCLGKTVTFIIKRHSFLTDATITTLTNASSLASSATQKWIASPADSNNYYFIASVTNPSSSATSGDLSVVSSLQQNQPAFCTSRPVNFCSDYQNQNECTQDLCNTSRTDSGNICDWDSTLNQCNSISNIYDSNGNLIGKCIYTPGQINGNCNTSEFVSYNWTAQFKYLNGTLATDPTGKCVNGQRTVECPAQIPLPFFNVYNIVVAVLIIAIVYYIVFLRSKKSHTKKR